MKNILVTGSNGQLGSELRRLASEFSMVKFHFTDVPELDISNETAIDNYLQMQSVDALINCAAYTAVDKAESEPEKAMLINATAPGLLAAAAAKYGFTFVHISTDYVFDGCNHRPYIESDPTGPVSAYGLSKLEGEKAILNSSANALIIRTSWMYSEFGHNFVKTIIRLAAEREELKVVFDQIGTPTYASNLARAILDILLNHHIKGSHVYHYSNEGICSWYDFAKVIVSLSGSGCRVTPIPSSGFPTPAPRPHYSVLDKSAIKNDFGIEIPWWYNSLKTCMEALAK
jgi:dTDP-4-dehydrorhamnose reductase